jgi:2,4-dienoyl-CoA reductase-like NADH-dependent reductase (Old Yellow Enzyme family)
MDSAASLTQRLRKAERRGQMRAYALIAPLFIFGRRVRALSTKTQDRFAQAVGFARHFIGNPDLVERIRQGWPLARFDRKTLYTPGEAGYADYPPYAAA